MSGEEKSLRLGNFILNRVKLTLIYVFFSKAALKHADSQGVIEKMEQEMARLKLKHSLEVKVRH